MAYLTSRESVLLPPVARGHVLSLRVIGRAGSSDLSALLAMRRCMRGIGSERAYLLQLDDCAWIDEDGGDVPRMSPPDELWRPSAVVVRPEGLPWWHRHALAQAQRGALCGVFICAARAQLWVQQRALALFPAPMAGRRTVASGRQERMRADDARHPQ